MLCSFVNISFLAPLCISSFTCLYQYGHAVSAHIVPGLRGPSSLPLDPFDTTLLSSLLEHFLTFRQSVFQALAFSLLRPSNPPLLQETLVLCGDWALETQRRPLGVLVAVEVLPLPAPGGTLLGPHQQPSRSALYHVEGPVPLFGPSWLPVPTRIGHRPSLCLFNSLCSQT